MSAPIDEESPHAIQEQGERAKFEDDGEQYCTDHVGDGRTDKFSKREKKYPQDEHQYCAGRAQEDPLMNGHIYPSIMLHIATFLYLTNASQAR
jgi:hypothetical protein